MSDYTTLIVGIREGRVVGYLTAGEFAKKCGVSLNTVRVWKRRGKIKCITIGRDIWVDADQPKPKRKPRSHN